jgi:hypothetical protein
MTLNSALLGVLRNGEDYEARNCFVVLAVAEAMMLGYPAGFRIDPAEPEWPVAFIELESGQVSWHLPQHPNEWDGHTTEERERRVTAYCDAYRKARP